VLCVPGTNYSEIRTRVNLNINDLAQSHELVPARVILRLDLRQRKHEHLVRGPRFQLRRKPAHAPRHE
jgi:hypothetical protein